MDKDVKKHKITLIYNYSPDELHLLRQCSFEAFVYRALPLSIIFGIGTAFCLRNSPKRYKLLGHLVVLGNTFGGYWIGSMSYAPICVDRLMNLPNSELGALIRSKKENKNIPTGTENTTSIQLAPFVSKTDAYTDEDYNRDKK